MSRFECRTTLGPKLPHPIEGSLNGSRGAISLNHRARRLGTAVPQQEGDLDRSVRRDIDEDLLREAGGQARADHAVERNLFEMAAGRAVLPLRPMKEPRQHVKRVEITDETKPSRESHPFGEVFVAATAGEGRAGEFINLR